MYRINRDLISKMFNTIKSTVNQEIFHAVFLSSRIWPGQGISALYMFHILHDIYFWNCFHPAEFHVHSCGMMVTRCSVSRTTTDHSGGLGRELQPPLDTITYIKIVVVTVNHVVVGNP